MARIGHGSTLTDKGTGGSGTDLIGEVTDIQIGGISLATVDSTTMDSEEAWREYIAGLLDAGELTFTIQSAPVNSGSSDNWHLVKDHQAARSLKVYQFRMPHGTTFTYSCYCTSIGIPVPLEDKIVTNVTHKISGKPTWANAA